MINWRWYLLFLFSFSTLLHASVVKPFDLLKSGTLTTYPDNVTTVGQATLYLLEPTKYKLAIGLPASSSSASIALKLIPPKARQDKIMPIYQALLLLMNQDERLIIDKKNKLISFETTKE